MENERIRILAVNPGTKYLGIALFKGAELTHWGIKTLKSKGMSESEVIQKVGKIIKTSIEEYKPTVMAVAMPASPQCRNNPLLKAIIRKINDMGRRKTYRVYSLAPLAAKNYLCRNGKVNKMEMEKVIVSQYYPWLYRRYEKDLEKVKRGHWWKRKYYFPLFDAIALGIYCYQKVTSSFIKRLKGSKGH